MTARGNLAMGARGVPVAQWNRLTDADAEHYGMTPEQVLQVRASEAYTTYRFGGWHVPTSTALMMAPDTDGGRNRFAINPDGTIAWDVVDGKLRVAAAA